MNATERQVCRQSVPENREAVIAIQGGGIYALPMLGQVRKVLQAGYVPIGFAGNSGGAILATLLWAGRTPNEIEDAFNKLLDEKPDGLTSLLLSSESEEQAFTLQQLHETMDSLRKMYITISRRSPFWLLKICRIILTARRLIAKLDPHWQQRGFFAGERFQEFIEGQVKHGLGIRSARRPVTFGDVNDGRPPLMLMATNVSRGSLELIDSTDRDYRNLSVAKAVRASAGFPGFFMPVDLEGVGAGRCFVDGGMISNFPLWAFSDAFRTKLQNSAVYGWLAPRPWLPIGIRVRDEGEAREVTAPSRYLRRLAAISTGMARNELEDRLINATQQEALIIEQDARTLPINPRTKRPLDVLDIDAVTKENISEIIRSGEEAAARRFEQVGIYTLYNPHCSEKIAEILEDLLRRCEHVMQRDPQELSLRANIFIPVEQRMEMCFSARMEGDPDDGLVFEDLRSGVTGWCYQTRSPAICDLRAVSEIWKKSAEDPSFQPPFKMSRLQQGRIRDDRSWLISYPVFDPTERQPLKRRDRLFPDVFGPALHPLKADMVGPLLGILSVDAGWDFDSLNLPRMVYDHVTDARIKAVIDTVAQASLYLARHLIRLPLD